MAQQGENTGLIDLNVLTQARAAARPTPSLFPPPPASSSLPPAAFAVEVEPARASKNASAKKRAWLAGVAPLVVPLTGAFVIALATFAAISSFPSEEPVTPPALAARMPVPAMGLPTATPDAITESATPSSASGLASHTASAPSTVTRAAKAGAVKASAPPQKAVRPAGDRCGCKGNFDCILRCSAKGK